VNDGEWHHLAVTSDGASAILYVDGGIQASEAWTTAITIQGGFLGVGLNFNDPKDSFDGAIDEVRIWSTQRTQTEITDWMNRELTQYVTGVEPAPPSHRYALLQNRPNPFNPRTEIDFELKSAGRARIRIYDVAGRLVQILVDAQLPAGPQRVWWNGEDTRGHRVASGAYFYRLDAAGFVDTKRMLLLR
jgi:hypothetical protein